LALAVLQLSVCVYWIPALARFARSAGMTGKELPFRNPRIEIIPVWIVLFDKLGLPGAFPVFQSLFTEDRLLNIIELFEIYQPMNSILLREALNEPLLMLINSSYEIVGDTDVKRAANSARQDIDPIALVGTHQYFTKFAASLIFADDATELGAAHP
jgi:hypothetical protein